MTVHAPPVPGHKYQSRRVRLCVLALLLIHAGLLGWIGLRNSPTLDEVAHLPAGLSHWTFGRFDLYRVNPPLVRMVATIPVLLADPETDWSGYYDSPYSRSEFGVGRQFITTNGYRSFWYFTLARWACIPLSLLGGWFCFLWGRALYGTGAGLLALTLWCFSPNILGNAGMMTPDAGAAAFGVMAGYAFWCWLRRPNWGAACLAGLALGAAELTKTTWIVLFLLWPVLWGAWRLTEWLAGRRRERGIESVVAKRTAVEPLAVEAVAPVLVTVVEPEPLDIEAVTLEPVALEPQRGPESQQKPNPAENAEARAPSPESPSILQLVAILIFGVYLINLAYGFEGSFTPLKKFQFISRSLGGPEAHRAPGNRFSKTWVGEIPVPVPRNYLRGIDVQRYDFEREKWSYLRGEQKKGGWWYWYLYALAVKVPLGTWMLAGLAASVAMSRRTRRARLRDEIVLLAPAVLVLGLVSSQTGFTRYLRYILPMFPFCLIWIGQAAVLMDRRTWFRGLLGGLAVVGTIVSSLSVYPHSLSYFHELAGGPRGGPRHLLDANIDWGQDLLYLQRWYDSNPQARPLHLQYFGFVSPRDAKIEFEPVPQQLRPSGGPQPPGDAAAPQPQNQQQRKIPGLVPGWYAISVNDLYGYRHYGGERDQYAYLRTLTPVATAGYSIYIYHLTEEDVRKLTGGL